MLHRNPFLKVFVQPFRKFVRRADSLLICSIFASSIIILLIVDLLLSKRVNIATKDFFAFNFKQRNKQFAIIGSFPSQINLFNIRQDTITEIKVFTAHPLMQSQPHSKAQNKICVCGSANGDCFMYVHHIPVPGQTIQATKYMEANGGKGANQAVAVGKLAGFCQFIGQVGNDSHMKNLQKEMSEGNVQLSWTVKENCTTGKAFIYVDETGENSIVIVGEANTNYDSLTELPGNFKKAIDANSYLLLQKEIPLEINVLAARYAKEHKKTVILDCGGSDYPMPPELLENLDYISPNETELLRLDSTIVTGDIVNEIRQKLIKKYPNLKVLLKEGSKGSSLITDSIAVHCPVSSNPQIFKDYKIIDTVGAGDCFTGAFAVRHSELEWSDKEKSKIESNYMEALRFGNSSAFLCITKNGAMPSQPWRKDVDHFIANYVNVSEYECK